MSLRFLFIPSLLVMSIQVFADGAKVDFAPLAKEFAEKTRPIVADYCLSCHSTEKQEGELDLERFKTLDDVRDGTAAWLKVVEMIHNGEMPPKDSDSLPEDKKKALLDWIDRTLQAVGRASAGDPGAVVLRRLSNAEYTYTVRDLTGVPLEPAKEFPADSAAGEGFTNTGNSLVMSPALLQKYLDAGKEIAKHAVLLPEGIRFSPSTTRGDWNNEITGRIRGIYERYAEVVVGEQVNLQGVVFNTNDGGRIPLRKYLEAASEWSGKPDVPAANFAKEKGLNAKYFALLTEALRGKESSLIGELGAAWRAQRPNLADEIEPWQRTLTRFQNVGHRKAWMVPTNPLTPRQEIRVKFPPEVTDTAKNPSGEVTLTLASADAGDGQTDDLVVWEQPRFVAPGRPDLLLRDVRDFTRAMTAHRARLFASTAEALAAALESRQAEKVDRAALAQKYGVDAESLGAWFDYLGIGTSAASNLDLFTGQVKGVGGYAEVTGWGLPELPSVVANSSDTAYRIPGNMPAHGIAVHPAPTLRVAIGWKSPITGSIKIEGNVTHAHPECGNGVTWTVDLRRSTTRRTLAEGIAHGGAPVSVGPIEGIHVEPGDLVSVLVGPRDGNHSCDLTDVEFSLTSADGKVWNLAADVSPNILTANPHGDSQGNGAVWHFFSEKTDGLSGAVIPAGSLLAKWQSAQTPEEAASLAQELERLLVEGPAQEAKPDDPSVVLYRQLSSLGGPLLARAKPAPSKEGVASTDVGLAPEPFGKAPDGSSIDPASLVMQAPAVIEIKLPAELVAGAEFVTAGSILAGHPKGSVQLIAVIGATPATDAVKQMKPIGTGFSSLDPSLPIIVQPGSETAKRFEQSFDAFRNLFPAALCYYKIVPVDEVITLTLFHREDDNLRRLMLSEGEAAELDELWRELHFVSQDKLTSVDALAQLLEYASQDSDPSLFTPMQKPINEEAAAFKQEQAEAEPKHLASVLKLAEQAYRRPLASQESNELRTLYAKLRGQGLAHSDAIQFTLARVFVSPAFLYRLEEAPAGQEAGPIRDFELATRLSYFLWSSAPDAELLKLANEGRLRESTVLAEQARRLLRDPRSRRLAQEFGLQWLQIYEFHTLDEKSERHFPEFVELRGDMEEEAVRFLADLFQTDGSVLTLFDADHTFVNERLAKFYGIPGVEGGDWRRIDGVKKSGRGGVLGFSATLAKNSGASRTSPILRGTWLSEVILGDKLPKPPKDVPILPDEDSASAQLSVRQLVEKHTSDERCSGCHKRIDPYGFALENYDAIGRHRTADLANHPIDAKTTLPDGKAIDGAEELRAYLLGPKREVVLHQFLKKLLGYSLGRSVQLSDEPLLTEIEAKLKGSDYRFSVAIEAIVQSEQFRKIRGRDVEVAGE